MPKIMTRNRNAAYEDTSLSFSPVENWIKNVYSLRMNDSTTSDQLSTISLLTYQFGQPVVHNSVVTPLFVQAIASSLSTYKTSIFNQLQRHLYPQSTPPINKKKKENIERNT